MAARWSRLLTAATAAGLAAAPPLLGGPVRTGFDAAALPAADDIAGPPTDLGFAVNFFGQSFSSVYVNSNGNVSFSAPLTAFSPVPLGLLGSAVVAPFFADVDTAAGGAVTYGTGRVDGRAAFAATWAGVGYHSTGPTAGNDFQAVFVDRSDTGAGNFDLEFNYGKVAWESGDFSGGVGGFGGSAARAGFTGGSAAATYELPGSGAPGALVDGSPTAVTQAFFRSDVPGRFVFASRGGAFDALPASPVPDGNPGTAPVPAAPGGGGVVGAPEPGTLALTLLGAGAVVVRRRRAGGI